MHASEGSNAMLPSFQKKNSCESKCRLDNRQTGVLWRWKPTMDEQGAVESIVFVIDDNREIRAAIKWRAPSSRAAVVFHNHLRLQPRPKHEDVAEKER